MTKWKDYHDETYGKDASIDVSNFVGKSLIKMIEFYQWRISPYLGSHCRFQPSCSEYMVRSIKKHGFIKGSMKGFWRILRCNPFCKCGVDEP